MGLVYQSRYEEMSSEMVWKWESATGFFFFFQPWDEYNDSLCDLMIFFT